MLHIAQSKNCYSKNSIFAKDKCKMVLYTMRGWETGFSFFSVFSVFFLILPFFLQRKMVKKPVKSGEKKSGFPSPHGKKVNGELTKLSDWHSKVCKGKSWVMS